MMRSIFTRLVFTSVIAPLLFLSGWVWGIQPDDELYNIKASVFIYSDHGICAINANHDNSVLSITHCGDPITVSNECYSEPSFTVCTATASLKDRSTTPCRQSMEFPVCLFTPVGGIYDNHLSPPEFFSAMEFLYIFCPNQLNNILFPKNNFHGSCLYNHATCAFSILRNPFSSLDYEEKIDCKPCSTIFLEEGGYTFASGNKTAHHPIQGCPVPKETKPLQLNIDSVESALSSWVFFVAVNEYSTGNAHEESENLVPDISAPMECNGAHVHENHLLTSDHCGKKLQKVLEKPALIKIFKADNEQAIGYITHSSLFHFSNDPREVGIGNASLISFEPITSTLLSPKNKKQFPKISSHPTDLYDGLYLIVSSPGNFSVKSCDVLMESEHANLYKVNHMEPPSWLSNGEPAFWQNDNHLEFVGWINLLSDTCSNNMNENCITPVTASLLPWINNIFAQAPDNNSTIITSGCFHVTTSKPANHSDSTPSPSDLSYLIKDILTPIGSAIVGGIITFTLTVCVCHFFNKRKSAFEMQRLPDTQ